MKKITKQQKIILIISLIIITIGTVIAATIGFNFDLKYDKSQKVELFLNKEFNEKDIKQIAKEVLGKKKVLIQKVEVYEDTVSIIAEEITEEQKQKIVEKVNEKYQTELKAEEITTENIPHNRGRDIVKPYIMPLTIATVFILVYLAVRYRTIGNIAVLLETIASIILVQVDLFGIIAITRIPVGRLTIPMAITAYLLTLLVCTNKYENKLAKEIAELEKDKK